jgi:hypothetical protein
MGTTASRLFRRKKDDDAQANALQAVRDPAHPPLVRLPWGPSCWKQVPFLPDNFLPPFEWTRLQKDVAVYGVTPHQLRVLFLRLCSPYDISLGTVPLRKFYREFDPRFRKVLRRILIQTAAGLPRMLFEDLVRFVFEFCGMDFFTLVTRAVRAVRDFDVMNTVTVRAVVRYITGDRGMDEFTRSVLAHLHADPPFHNVAAFVQLCARYPVLVYPVILMQRSMQRRFFGMRFWREYQKRSGTQLLPPDFSRVDSATITARVLLMECVSLSATPFQFGTARTATEPPSELLEQELRRRRRRRRAEEADDDDVEDLAAELEELDAEDEENEEALRQDEETDRTRMLEAAAGGVGKAARAQQLRSRGDLKLNFGGAHPATQVTGFLALASPAARAVQGRRSSEVAASMLGGGRRMSQAAADAHRRASIAKAMAMQAVFQERRTSIVQRRLSVLGTAAAAAGANEGEGAAPSPPAAAAASADGGAGDAAPTSSRAGGIGKDSYGISIVSTASGGADDTPRSGERGWAARRRASLALMEKQKMMADDSRGGGGEGSDAAAAADDESSAPPVVSPFLSATTMRARDRRRSSVVLSLQKGSVGPEAPVEAADVAQSAREARRTSVVAAEFVRLQREADEDWGHKAAEAQLYKKLDQTKRESGRRDSQMRNRAIFGGYGLSVDEGGATGFSSSRTGGSGGGSGPGADPPSAGIAQVRARLDSMAAASGAALAEATSKSAVRAEDVLQAQLDFRELGAGPARRASLAGTSYRRASVTAASPTGAATTLPGAVSTSPDPPERRGSIVGRRKSAMGIVLPAVAAIVTPSGAVVSGPSAAAPSAQSAHHLLTAPKGATAAIATATAMDAFAKATVAATVARRASVVRRASIVERESAVRRQSALGAGFAAGVGGGGGGGLTGLAAAAAAAVAEEEAASAAKLRAAASPVVVIRDEQAPSSEAKEGEAKEGESKEEGPGAAAAAAAVVPARPSRPTRAARMADEAPPPAFDVMDKIATTQEGLEKPLTDRQRMAQVNAMATLELEAAGQQNKEVVVFNLASAADAPAPAVALEGKEGDWPDGGPAKDVEKGFSAIDTRIRLAAFGFSDVMGSNMKSARERRILVTSDKTLPIPVPPKVPEYILDHPHPAGAVLKLTSLQISKVIYAHAASGAGQFYGIVRVPCLLCHRIILHIDDLIVEEEDEAAIAAEDEDEEGGYEDDDEDETYVSDEDEDDDGRGGGGDDEEDDEARYEGMRRYGSVPDAAGAGGKDRGSQQREARSRTGTATGSRATTAASQGVGEGAEGEGTARGRSRRRRTREWQREREEDAETEGSERAEGRRIATSSSAGSGRSARSGQSSSTAGSAAGRGRSRRGRGRGSQSRSRSQSQSSAAASEGSAATEDRERKEGDDDVDDDDDDEGVGRTRSQQGDAERGRTRSGPSAPATATATQASALPHGTDGGYYEDDRDSDDMDGYKRKEDENQFTVKAKHRAGKRKKGKGSKDGGGGDLVRDRMQAIRAKEAEVRRRVALIKREQEKIAREDARLKALNGGGSDAFASGPVITLSATVAETEEERGREADLANMAEDDEAEDVAVKIITAKAMRDPRAIVLVDGSVPGAVAGKLKPVPPGPQAATTSGRGGRGGGRGGGSRRRRTATSQTTSMASDSYYSESSVGTEGTHGGPSLEALERMKRERERLAREQVFAKTAAKNTGFCGDCDLYLSRVAAQLFGYKLSHRFVDAATIKPSVEDELARHSAKARLEKHPLVQGKAPDDESLVMLQKQAAETERLRQEAAAAAEAAGADEEGVAAAAAAAAPDSDMWRRIERDVYEYPDDNFLELWDDETKRFFYYNVTVGHSQWFKPRKFTAYMDPEEKKEEEAIQKAAKKELSKLEEFAAKASKGKVQTSLGQR